MLSDAAAVTGPREIMIEVLRYRSEADQKPVPRIYRVPFTDDMSVLQGLQYIKDHINGTLSFRWSCRMAICGSCGMMIGAEPKIACMTFLRHYYPGPLTIEPLAHFPIERDLVASIDDFIKKIDSIYPYLIPKTHRSLEEGEHLQTPSQLAQYEMHADGKLMLMWICYGTAGALTFMTVGALAIIGY